MQTTFGPLQFLPVKLNESAEVCLRFVIDAFVESYGSAERFFKENGTQGEVYLEWLKGKIEKDPASVVHIWETGEIIGQMELGVFRPQPSTGFVSLYYLVADKRGKGYSMFLEQYVESFLKERGFSKARLSVSPTNARAVAYYKKAGWTDLGPRPDYPALNFMEKNFWFEQTTSTSWCGGTSAPE